MDYLKLAKPCSVSLLLLQLQQGSRRDVLVNHTVPNNVHFIMPDARTQPGISRLRATREYRRASMFSASNLDAAYYAMRPSLLPLLLQQGSRWTGQIEQQT